MPDPSDAPVPEADPMPRSLVLLLAVACALSVANVYYAQPLLDAIGREFGLAEGAVGIVVTATQLGCALALAGALKAIPDEPGVLAVVMFPDNAYKYLSSFRRHLPDLFPPEEPVAPVNPFASHLEAAFRLAKQGPDVIDVAEAKRLLDAGVTVVDVRNPDEVARVQIPQAVKLPLPDLSAGSTAGLPDDRTAPVVTICSAGTP